MMKKMNDFKQRMKIMQEKNKIAMGQMLVEPGQIEANLERACQFIREAANKGCHIIVLPECMDLGWTHPGAKELARPIPGKSTHILCDVAREMNIYVVTGLTERSGEKVYNSAVIISNTGDIVLTHRKINELD